MAKYDRSYINLIEDCKRYSKKNKKVYGKCILEERNGEGKIVVSVENLEENNTYYLYLLMSQHGQYVAVKLDRLNLKNKTYELKEQLKNGVIKDTKFVLSDVVAVMIGVEEEKVIPILVGYKNERINYKGNFYVYRKKEEKIISNKEEEKKAEKKEEKKPKVKYKDDVQNRKEKATVKYKDDKTRNESKQNNYKKEEVQKEVQKEEVQKNKEEPIKLEEAKEDTNVEEVKKVTVKYKDDKEKEVERNKEEKLEDDRASIKDFFNEMFNEEEQTQDNIFTNIITKFKEELDEIKYISEVSNNEFMRMNTSVLQLDLSCEDADVEYIFTHNNQIKPYMSQNRNVEWVIIDLDELTAVSKKCWELRKNLLILESYATYGHLILGRYKANEEMNYLIGIPSIYNEENLTRAKEIGVIQYKPCDNPQLNEKIEGYWIMLNK